MNIEFSHRDLEALETRIEEALARGKAGDLEVLGWGEISSVVAWQTTRGRFACKRLPVFPVRDRFVAFRDCFNTYLKRLGETGIRVVGSELRHLTKVDGRVVGYCIQRALDPGCLVHNILSHCEREVGVKLFEGVLDRVFGFVTDRFGLDAQLSNWAVVDGTLYYFDVTTPIVRDSEGRPVLDVDLFLASIPRVFRWAVKRFMLMEIIAKYCRPRDVVIDLLGNLHKEKLDRWIPAFIEHANARISPPIRAEEVRKYYASDARTWALLLGLRRVDRFFHLKVLRRPYPFLLPGKIERNV